MESTLYSARIQALAHAIATKSISAEDVPVYERDMVQECLITEWLENEAKRLKFQQVLKATFKH